jgi:predicted SnoaL-like aldol condensation-catalyzing enzyme
MDLVQPRNRDIVLAFFKEGLEGKQIRQAFEEYVCPNFVEHKPDVEFGTREATITYLENLIQHLPDCKWELIRTISEGDMVVLHARFIPALGAQPYAVADIFRLADGKIVEHWDVIGQPANQQLNPNPRF